jgi:hypothetical protein
MGPNKVCSFLCPYLAKSRPKLVRIFHMHSVYSVDLPMKITIALNIRLCGICGVSALFAVPGSCKCPNGVEDECCMQRTSHSPKDSKRGRHT